MGGRRRQPARQGPLGLRAPLPQGGCAHAGKSWHPSPEPTSPGPGLRVLLWCPCLLSPCAPHPTLTPHAHPPHPTPNPNPPQVNFLLLTSVGVLLPLRLHLPLHLAFLALVLRATAQRCRSECAVPAAAVQALGGAPAFQQYYAAAVHWVRRLNPRALWRLPPGWRPGAAAVGGCLGSCFAVHAFLQVGTGRQAAGVHAQPGEQRALPACTCTTHAPCQPAAGQPIPRPRCCCPARRRWAACCSP